MRLWSAATLVTMGQMTRETPGASAPAQVRDPALKSLTLKFLGHQGQEVSSQLEGHIDEALRTCVELTRPGVARRTFARDALPLELPGTGIATHLGDACEVALFAVTLGADVDRELRRRALTDPYAQVLFDAAASALVERLADKTEAHVREEAAARGLFCSWRYSPGYGDLPLSVQGRLLAVLDATKRLGISLTPSNLMVPTKSVTAIVGIHPTPQPGLASSCAICELAAFCTLRSRGLSCGH